MNLRFQRVNCQTIIQKVLQKNSTFFATYYKTFPSLFLFLQPSLHCDNKLSFLNDQ